MIDWSHVDHFNPDEFDDPHFPGSGKNIDPAHLYRLCRLRAVAGCPVRIHASVGGGVDVKGEWRHTVHSYHLLERGAKATDIDLDTDMPYRQQLALVLSCGFGGVGWYPWWGNKGFHVDSRPIAGFSLWISPREGRYEYFI